MRPGFILGALHGLVGYLAASQEANDHAHGKGDHSGCGHKGEFHIPLASRPAHDGAGGTSKVLGAARSGLGRSRGAIGPSRVVDDSS